MILAQVGAFFQVWGLGDGVARLRAVEARPVVISNQFDATGHHVYLLLAFKGD
jgi:hypothetical protein